MPAGEHNNQIVDAVRCAIITVSDSRTPETDKSGSLIRERLESAGHLVADYKIIPDDVTPIGDAVRRFCEGELCQAVILTGGTGIARRDVTLEALHPLLERHIEGFGELFRMLSYKEVGAAAMLSRAFAGVCCGTAVFALPGSTAAVRLAMDDLILPELGHMVSLLSQ